MRKLLQHGKLNLNTKKMSKEIKTYKETPIEKVDLSKLEIDETYSCIQLGLQTIMRWDGKKFEDCMK